MKEREKEKFIFYSTPPYSEAVAPLVSESVRAGFASPANNYIEEQLDLNKFCVKNPPATFFVRVEGDSMVNAGIYRNDILVVDRSLEAKNNDIIIAILNGEFTLKRLIIEKEAVFLYPENNRYKPIRITEAMEFEVWGKVTKVIHDL